MFFYSWKDLTRPSVLALIGANLIPLFGVMFFHWSLWNILCLFWIENLVIGGFNVIKILVVGKWEGVMFAIFFLMHYGGLSLGHLALLHGLFYPADAPHTGWSVSHGGWSTSYSGLSAFFSLGKTIVLTNWIGASSLAMSHGISFVTNFLGHREFERLAPAQQLMAPYGRIASFQFILLVGAHLSLKNLGIPLRPSPYSYWRKYHWTWRRIFESERRPRLGWGNPPTDHIETASTASSFTSRSVHRIIAP